MKPLALLLTVLFTLQLSSQNQDSILSSPGSIGLQNYSDNQNEPADPESQRFKLKEFGITFGQDFPSGDSAHMYLDGRLGMSYGKHLGLVSYGLSNPWDFGIGGSPNLGNTSIFAAAYGQNLNLFDGFETEAYLGVSYLSVETEEGSESFWGLPLTLVLDKPIFDSLSLGLVGQLQPTTKKARALFGLKVSYDLNP